MVWPEILIATLQIIIIVNFTIGAEDHKFSVDLDLLDYAETNYGFPNSCEAHFCQTEEFAAYGTKVLEDYSLHHPVSWQEALQLYFLLLNDIDSM